MLHLSPSRKLQTGRIAFLLSASFGSDPAWTVWVTNLAQYLNSVSAFSGQVIFVTQPPGQKGCETAAAPNVQPAQSVRAEADLKKVRLQGVP